MEVSGAGLPPKSETLNVGSLNPLSSGFLDSGSLLGDEELKVDRVGDAESPHQNRNVRHCRHYHTACYKPAASTAFSTAIFAAQAATQILVLQAVSPPTLVVLLAASKTTARRPATGNRC